MALRRKQASPGQAKKRAIEHTGFFAYLQHYLEALAIQGYSQTTIKNRDSLTREFIQWCDERDLKTPQEITKPILERYQKYLHYYRQANGKPRTRSSQKNAVVALKGFFKWLAQQNHLLYNPASELQAPKTPTQLPRVILSLDDINSILDQPDIETPDGLRDRVIMELFYSTGLRRTELVNLNTDDIDLRRGTLIVKNGKGNKDRYLPLSETMQAWLIKYLEAREQLEGPRSDDRLFLTDYGEPYEGSHLGHQIKRYLKQANINATGSCHLFRHAMATHMLDNGADIRFIQAMLGHSDLNTTQVYTHVSIEKLRALHAATHPAGLTHEAAKDADL